MAYNGRHGGNPDALPAHAEPEQAAAMFGGQAPPPAPSRQYSQSQSQSQSRPLPHHHPPPQSAPAAQAAQTAAARHDDRYSSRPPPPAHPSYHDDHHRQSTSSVSPNPRYDNYPPPRQHQSSPPQHQQHQYSQPPQPVYQQHAPQHQPPPPQQRYSSNNSMSGPPPAQKPYASVVPPQNPYSSSPPAQNPYASPPPARNPYASPPPPAPGPRPTDYHDRPPPSQHQRSSNVAPPTNAANDRDTLWSLFCAVDADRTGQLSEASLRRALVNGDYTAFDPHTVKMMIRMFDTDRSGTINFDEFCGLWGFLAKWRTLFDRFDLDRSGSINFTEFSSALEQFGYRLSAQFVQLLFSTFARNVGGRGDDKGRTMGLSFDLFVQACISLKRMTDVFRKYDEDRDGVITITFEEFLTGAQSLFLFNSISPLTDTGLY